MAEEEQRGTTARDTQGHRWTQMDTERDTEGFRVRVKDGPLKRQSIDGA